LAAHLQDVIFCLFALELFQKSVAKSPRLLHICRKSSTNHTFLCKTNPILARPKMNLTLYLKRIYEKYSPLRTVKNEPKTNPISENPKMDLTPYKKSNYVKYMTFGLQKNEPNSKPISRVRYVWLGGVFFVQKDGRIVREIL